MDANESAIARLKAALSCFADPPDVDDLAGILACAAERERVTYEEAQQSAGGDVEEALLLACQQRLLVPLRSIKDTLEWDDAVTLPKPGETYKMPNVVRHLVNKGAQSGEWDPQGAVAQTFKEMGDPSWEAMPGLVAGIFQAASHNTISATSIGQVCRQLGMRLSVDTLIAELKAGGMMSPKLASIAAVVKAGSPLYELSPALLPSSRRDTAS